MIPAHLLAPRLQGRQRRLKVFGHPAKLRVLLPVGRAEFHKQLLHVPAVVLAFGQRLPGSGDCTVQPVLKPGHREQVVRQPAADGAQLLVHGIHEISVGPLLVHGALLPGIPEVLPCGLVRHVPPGGSGILSVENIHSVDQHGLDVGRTVAHIFPVGHAEGAQLGVASVVSGGSVEVGDYVRSLLLVHPYLLHLAVEFGRQIEGRRYRMAGPVEAYGHRQARVPLRSGDAQVFPYGLRLYLALYEFEFSIDEVPVFAEVLPAAVGGGHGVGPSPVGREGAGSADCGVEIAVARQPEQAAVATLHELHLPVGVRGYEADARARLAEIGIMRLEGGLDSHGHAHLRHPDDYEMHEFLRIGGEAAETVERGIGHGASGEGEVGIAPVHHDPLRPALVAVERDEHQPVPDLPGYIGELEDGEGSLVFEQHLAYLAVGSGMLRQFGGQKVDALHVERIVGTLASVIPGILPEHVYLGGQLRVQGGDFLRRIAAGVIDDYAVKLSGGQLGREPVPELFGISGGLEQHVAVRPLAPEIDVIGFPGQQVPDDRRDYLVGAYDYGEILPGLAGGISYLAAVPLLTALVEPVDEGGDQQAGEKDDAEDRQDRRPAPRGGVLGHVLVARVDEMVEDGPEYSELFGVVGRGQHLLGAQPAEHHRKGHREGKQHHEAHDPAQKAALDEHKVELDAAPEPHRQGASEVCKASNPQHGAHYSLGSAAGSGEEKDDHRRQACQDGGIVKALPMVLHGEILSESDSVTFKDTNKNQYLCPNGRIGDKYPVSRRSGA